MAPPEVLAARAVLTDAGPVTVALRDVHVHFRTPAAGLRARHGAVRGARLRDRLPGRGAVLDVHALAGVSLVARAGESVGVLGLNGSGKTTLLRVMAGLELPSRGEVYATSPPTLLGVNAALQPELSGVQNIHLGCLAMGLTPEAAAQALPEVAAFADLGDHLHAPMRTYSSGMSARLRFAIALVVLPDILLIDEALATGDAAFKERSARRMEEVRRNAGTVFLVSHAATTIQEECTRAVWLHEGRTVQDGPGFAVAERYRHWAWTLAKGDTAKADRLLRTAIEAGTDTDVQFAGTAMGPVPGRWTGRSTRRSAIRHTHRRSRWAALRPHRDLARDVPDDGPPPDGDAS